MKLINKNNINFSGMKKYIFNFLSINLLRIIYILILSIVSSNFNLNAQACGFETGDGCPNTDYNNFGMGSTINASTIEYDNFVSSYHQSVVRTSDGDFLVWGERISATAANVLSPLEINSINFPGLTGKPLKVTLGSSGGRMQGILLADDGLYAWGEQGRVLASSITSSNNFQKISIGGNANGLPSGVTPTDVKMIQATYETLSLVTCNGNVWMISQNPGPRGNGGSGNSTTWYRVTTNATGNPFLTNVVACRVMGDGSSYNTVFALRADGTMWTWGRNTYLGNGSAQSARTRATQMVSPPATTPKMISVTRESYLVLSTTGRLFSLGRNSERQLGDWTTTERRSWVQPRYNSSTGPVMNNIHWINAQEHDRRYASVNVLTQDSVLYAWGDNDRSMIGQPTDPSNPRIPNNLTSNDKVLAVETGGHTTMIVKLCEPNFGYVGHRTSGSMGSGDSGSATESVYTFDTAPVQICGAETDPALATLPPIITGPSGNFCVNEPLNLDGSPSGGTYSVVSGPGTINSFGVLTFTGIGTVVVNYALPADVCSGDVESVNRPFTSENCVADLEISKTTNIEFPEVGSNIIFTLEVTNNGTDDASQVEVSDQLPSGFTYVDDNGGGAFNSTTGVWNIGVLANGSSISLEIEVTVNASGDYTNVATVSTNLIDPDTSNNTDEVTVEPAVIVANDDFFGPINGFSATANAGNIYDNDLINNSSFSAGDVNLTITSPASPINGGGCLL